MSKMSNLHLELTEQANRLGFESIEQAETYGYRIDYSGDGWSLKPDINRVYAEAHKAWLKEREGVLADLREILKDYLAVDQQDEVGALNRAIKFIEEDCYDR